MRLGRLRRTSLLSSFHYDLALHNRPRSAVTSFHTGAARTYTRHVEFTYGNFLRAYEPSETLTLQIGAPKSLLPGSSAIRP